MWQACCVFRAHIADNWFSSRLAQTPTLSHIWQHHMFTPLTSIPHILFVAAFAIVPICVYLHRYKHSFHHACQRNSCAWAFVLLLFLKWMERNGGVVEKMLIYAKHKEEVTQRETFSETLDDVVVFELGRMSFREPRWLKYKAHTLFPKRGHPCGAAPQLMSPWRKCFEGYGGRGTSRHHNAVL